MEVPHLKWNHFTALVDARASGKGVISPRPMGGLRFSGTPSRNCDAQLLHVVRQIETGSSYASASGWVLAAAAGVGYPGGASPLGSSLVRDRNG
jgi:hypothetical protein